MNNNIVDRASEFIKYKGISPADFERIVGLANGMLKKLSDKTRHQTFIRISNAFPDLNIDWLRTGEGEMLKKYFNIIQNGDGDNHQQGQAGHDLTQTINPPCTFAVESVITQIENQRKLTESAQRQIDKSQEQIDRLLSIIERMQNNI